MHYARWNQYGSFDPPEKYIRPIRPVTCCDCGRDFQTQATNQKRCPSCVPEYQREQNRAYRARNAEKLSQQHKEKRHRNPEKYRENARRLRQANPERQAEYQKRYQEKHRDKISLKRRSKQFGISVTMLMTMLEFQEYRCAICLEAVAITGPNRYTLDHCHDTGEIRGILCALCNTGIGMLRDNPALCEIAAVYLRTTGKYQSLASGE
jgi:hypothetical protein